MKADLPVHKLLCGVSPPAVGYRSSHNGQPAYPTFLALMFPATEGNPKWVSCNGNYRYAVYNSYSGGYYPNPPHPATLHLKHLGTPVTITGNALRSRSRTLDKLEIYATKNTPSSDCTLNLSVLAVTNQRPAQSWYGSLIAVKVSLPATGTDTGASVAAPQYRNIDMVDFRDIVDLLCTHPATDINDMTSSIAAAVATPKFEVSAVRINCRGDQALGRAPFERVQLRADDPACRAPVTAISRLIQFPVRVSRCLPPHVTGFDAESHQVVNPSATDLSIGVDPATDWGFVGLEWVDPAGSVFVVRDGGKELHPQHVEALCHWCLYVLRPLFQDSMGMGTDPLDPMDKEKVLARIEKREWECFYRGFDEWKGVAGGPWVKRMWPC